MTKQSRGARAAEPSFRRRPGPILTFANLVRLTALALLSASAFSQTYPSRPIELVSSTGAGGGSDLVCRLVADIIGKEKLLPQPVFVVSKPGGGGAMGQTYVSSRRADPCVLAKNMYEDVYMNDEGFGRWHAAQQTEMTQLLTELGLAHRK